MGTPRHQSRDTDGALALALESRPFDYAPSVPQELAALANRATARDPAARPADAWQVRQAIADYLQHRSSIALAASAAERVARLRALVGDEAALGRESVQHDLDVLAGEARFGLEQALREWKDNPVALRALEELDALQASRRARSAALERLARELDPSISSRQRAIGLGVLAVVGVALSIGGFLTEQATLTPRALFYQSLAPLGGVLVVAVVLRRHLFGTDLNRRLAHAAIVEVLSVVASNAVGCAAGVSVPHLLAFDALVFAAITAQGAALMFRWLAFFSVVMLGVAVWAASFPDQAMRAFSLGTGVSLVVSAWLSRGSARKSRS